MITNVMTRWQGAVELLAPRRLKLFLLVVAKNVMSNMHFLGHHFWWAYVILCVTSLVGLFFPGLFVVPAKVVSLFLLMGIMLAARPALERKDGDYFMRYIVSVRGIALVIASCVFERVLGVPYLAIVCIPIAVLSVFFWFDKEANVANMVDSVTNAALFCVYNLPLSLLFGALGVLCYSLMHPYGANPLYYHPTIVSTGIGIAVVLLKIVCSELLKIFFVSLMCCWYAKVKYEHFTLFFTN